MTLPSKNAYLSRAARRTAKWEKLIAEGVSRPHVIDPPNNATVAKYRKRITLARTSIEKETDK